jgi:NADH-quinone oxidoreductase subunit L
VRAWIVLDDLASADTARHESDTAPREVRTAVTVLAVLTVFGGLVVLTPWLHLKGHINWFMALVSVLLIVGAAWAIRSVAHGADPARRLVGARMPAFDAGLGVDALYVAAVARPVLALARIGVFLDREVVDAYVRGTGAAAKLAGARGGEAHRTERAASGLAWLVAGVLAVALAGVALW